eukprot:CAMPEP_0203823916 /NCGR_PEP_ID=MMETSP0115-20131106/50405_1 /ASSEMBLY_ACC=CAM_ASM_000227 /TAXON_ID=33651 /ORGANISM="Bicosoecid sp, Strain ms1" /LENGTH=60 /DNA_ID=CAMNT_0050732951 /DNA_START=105 /DNA_END=283 /DNA_ORIENTATION=+
MVDAWSSTKHSHAPPARSQGSWDHGLNPHHGLKPPARLPVGGDCDSAWRRPATRTRASPG